jgi:hypothetical protein
MKTLSEYMKEQQLTDEMFGDMVGRCRLQILRYRQGTQIPSRRTMARIFKVTGGAVPPSSFYTSSFLKETP